MLAIFGACADYGPLESGCQTSYEAVLDDNFGIDGGSFTFCVIDELWSSTGGTWWYREHCNWE